MRSRIHLDHNASALMAPAVLHWLAGASQGNIDRSGKHFPQFQNGSAVHADGQYARSMIESARDSVLSLTGFDRKSATLTFTSGATESNNWLLSKIAAKAIHGSNINGSELPHVIVAATEHSCVVAPIDFLESQQKIKLTKVFPRTKSGLESADFAADVTQETVIVCCMAANNETGEVPPAKEIFAAVRAKNPKVWCHCDAAQYLGKMQSPLAEIEADSYSISGHKIGGLAGVGATIVSNKGLGGNRGYPLESFLLGGPQETFRRAGTENLVGIVSFGIAAENIHESLGPRIEGMEKNKAIFETLLGDFPELFSLQLFGKLQLPNTISLSLAGIKAQDAVVALDMAGINVSSGAACASGKPNPSHVLLAHGLTPEAARQTLRLSFEPEYPAGALVEAGRIFVSTIQKMQQ